MFVLILGLYIIASMYLRRSVRQSKLRGTYGEREVDAILAGIAEKMGGIEFLDLLLKKGTHYTQIDNILLTSKALYVIETKDYSGWIFGSQKNKYWTQTFRSHKGVKKYKFYNPIMQNKTHIDFLKDSVPILNSIPIYNIIVFTGSGNLKNIEHNNDIHVIYSYGLKYLIDEKQEELPSKLSLEAMINITDELYRLNTYDFDEKQNHISQVQNKHC
jgi:hypothetical protein